MTGEREALYPWSDGIARHEDPTYGRIDRDIQWWAWDQLAGGGQHTRVNIASLAALEYSLQERRDLGYTVLGVIPRSRTADGRDADAHVRATRRSFALVLAPAGLIVAGAWLTLYALGVFR